MKSRDWKTVELLSWSRRVSSLGCLAAVILMCFGFATAAQAQIYTVQTFDLGGGSDGATVPTAINNKGRIVGYTTFPAFFGFLLPSERIVGSNSHPNGEFTFFYSVYGKIVGSGSGTLPTGINDAGVVVGDYGSAFGFVVGPPPYPAYAAAVPPLDPPPGAGMCPICAPPSYGGMNNNGDIVGSYADGSYIRGVVAARHGFLLSHGIYTTIDFPGAYATTASGINDSGQIVGYYFTGDGREGTHGFLLSGGVFTTIDFPSTGTGFRSGTYALGINNSGVVVGRHYGPELNGTRGGCWLWHAGVTTQVSLALSNKGGLDGYGCSGINDAGQLIGESTGNAASPGFLATPASIYDPVPDLLNGPKVVGVDDIVGTGFGRDKLATLGRPVLGVSADGVSQVLIRIPAANEGDQFSISVLNDQQDTSSSTDQDGGLGNTGSDNFDSHQVLATAVSTNSGPFAFAVYRAPVDFVRGKNFPQDASSTSTSRKVTIKIDSLGGSSSLQVAIVRPPVVLIHGLWGNSSTWKNFAGAFPGFQVGYANYSSPVGPAILVSDPLYLPLTLPNIATFAKANSLGFKYNAPNVLGQIRNEVQKLKLGTNPAGIPVAAIQADIVAHSMGGDITRTLPLEDDFFRNPSFGKGEIHKLITIDTPHLGSPLPIQLLKSRNACVRVMLAATGQISFNSVTFLNFQTVPGAIGDLQGDGHDADSGIISDALANIRNPGIYPVSTALIAGTVAQGNLLGLDTETLPRAIKCLCGSFALPLCGALPSSPLADSLTSAGWPTIFGGPSDAIVSLNSQMNGLDPSMGSTVSGVHSGALNLLGFGGPSVLDPGPVPAKVLDLLNTPKTDPLFIKLPQQ